MNQAVNKKAIFDNTFWQIIIRLFTLVITLVSIKILTNYLGAEGVGKYNTITTYINFFIVIADFGLFAVTVREISQNPDQEKKVLANVFTIRLWSALAACILAAAIVLATKYDQEIKLGALIACGFLFFNLLASVYDMLLQARLKMQYSALSELISRIISVAALAVIVWIHGSFLWIAATIALWGIFIFIFKWLFATRLLHFGLSHDRIYAKQIVNMAWPLGIVFIVSNLYFKMDTLILFAIKGAAAAGIYTVAFKVLDVIAFMSSYFSSALKPAISQNIKNDPKTVSAIMQRGISVMLMAATIISVTAIAYRNEIILLLSSPEFSDSAKVLIFLSFSLPIIFINNLIIEVFIANDSRSAFLKISLTVFVINLLLNLLLIPRFSYFGAATANLASALVSMLIYFYSANKIVRFNPNWLTVIKFIIIALILLASAVLMKSLHIYYLIGMLLTFLFYLALLYIFRIVKVKEVKEILAHG